MILCIYQAQKTAVNTIKLLVLLVGFAFGLILVSQDARIVLPAASPSVAMTGVFLGASWLAFLGYITHRLGHASPSDLLVLYPLWLPSPKRTWTTAEWEIVLKITGYLSMDGMLRDAGAEVLNKTISPGDKWLLLQCVSNTSWYFSSEPALTPPIEASLSKARENLTNSLDKQLTKELYSEEKGGGADLT